MGSPSLPRVCVCLSLPRSLMAASPPLSLAPSSPEFKRSDKRKATAVTAAAPDLPEVKEDCKPREGSPKRSGINNVQLIPAIWNGDGDGDGAEQTVGVRRALTDFPRVICPPPSFPFDRSPFFAVFRSISPLLSLENVPIAAGGRRPRGGRRPQSSREHARRRPGVRGRERRKGSDAPICPARMTHTT